jgi:hypothetical protein
MPLLHGLDCLCRDIELFTGNIVAKVLHILQRPKIDFLTRSFSPFVKTCIHVQYGR